MHRHICARIAQRSPLLSGAIGCTFPAHLILDLNMLWPFFHAPPAFDTWRRPVLAHQKNHLICRRKAEQKAVEEVLSILIVQEYLPAFDPPRHEVPQDRRYVKPG
jgi:hypothetical protein